VLCLDFNRNVRLAHKGELPGKQNWTAEQHFESIRARWLREVRENKVAAELSQFLKPMQLRIILCQLCFSEVAKYLKKKKFEQKLHLPPHI